MGLFAAEPLVNSAWACNRIAKARGKPSELDFQKTLSGSGGDRRHAGTTMINPAVTRAWEWVLGQIRGAKAERIKERSNSCYSFRQRRIRHSIGWSADDSLPCPLIAACLLKTERPIKRMDSALAPRMFSPAARARDGMCRSHCDRKSCT